MDKPLASSGSARVGAVVIGRNEGARLVRCFASLAAERIPIVYVDSGSSDGSPAAARAAGAIIVDLDLTSPFTAARARNAGARALLAGHPAIAHMQFIDGDCSIVTGWIEKAVAFLDAEPDYAVACGRRRERYPEKSFYNWLADIEWNTPIGEANACGGDALIRTEAFRSVGGYNSALIAGEEPELCSRLRAAGWLVRRLDADMSSHDIDMHRFSQWWRRSARGGHAFAEVSRLTAAHGEPIFHKETRRALLWGIGIPAAAIALALVSLPLVLIPIVVVATNVIRVALRNKDNPIRWRYACMLMLSKFAETHGIIRYQWARASRNKLRIIEYK